MQWYGAAAMPVMWGFHQRATNTAKLILDLAEWVETTKVDSPLTEGRQLGVSANILVGYETHVPGC